jgi:hypothetical protein
MAIIISLEKCITEELLASMHLRLGVNFINVLQAAFAQADPKRAKKTDNLTVFYVLSGSAGTKAARRMLMKLRPGFCFLNLNKLKINQFISKCKFIVKIENQS